MAPYRLRIVQLSVDAIDEDIVPVLHLVGEANADNFANDQRVWIVRTEENLISRAELDPRLHQDSLHCFDHVTL